ncbi:TRAP transporter small permease [Pelagibacterium montanilacus]|uniref:TRAP transporter small permease n=1 Tax=Pelagibacterium montanilacus TaxID=2185280 RepID=UPI0013DF8370|nr:TRAP transporter small permease subunit [Pelagibacterium montanilacus]
MTYFQKFAQLFDTFSGYVDRFCRIGLMVTASLILLLLITQVGMRYVLRSPLIWVEELAAYTLGFMVLWGAASYIRTWQHIQVNTLFLMMPLAARTAAVIAINLLLLWFAYLLVVSGNTLAQLGANELSPSGTFVMFWPRQGMTTGGILIIIQATNNILRCLSGRPGEMVN